MKIFFFLRETKEKRFPKNEDASHLVHATTFELMSENLYFFSLRQEKFLFNLSNPLTRTSSLVLCHSRFTNNDIIKISSFTFLSSHECLLFKILLGNFHS